MLQAFVDDSISQTGERRLFLAAYVATAESWALFSDAWDEVLSADPKIEYFKMAEAHARRGQFERFSEKQRNRKVFALAEVIQKFRPWAFHSSISTVDFDRLVRPHSPYPMQTPYFEVFFAIVIGVAQVHKSLGVDLPCDFIFDQHDGLPGKVLPAFEAMLATAPGELREIVGGTPIFRDDKDFLPLQAADLLAWHVRRAGDGNYPHDYEGLMNLVTPPEGHYFTEITVEHLEGMGRGLAAIPRTGEITRDAWRKVLDEFGGQLPRRPFGFTVALPQHPPHALTVKQARGLRWLSAGLPEQYPVQSPALGSVSPAEAKLIRPDRSWSESPKAK